MSSSDDLTKALARNGDYDPKKAGELRTGMVGTFEAQMRKVERYLWVYVCLCCWLAVFALFHFLQSSSTKALLFYGILTIIFIETIVLMKLWYWIMNSKIGVLKAIKQIELRGAVTDDVAEVGKAITGLSRRERRVWWLVLLAGGALIGAVKGAEVSNAVEPWSLGSGKTLTAEGRLTLAPDGSGSLVSETSLVYEGTLARRGFNVSAPESMEVRFTDGRGQELPFTISPQNGHLRYDVRLPRPVMPGRRFSYKQFGECPRLATEDGSVWTCSGNVVHGYDTNKISQTVVLPTGAEIVSVDPWPASTFTLLGKPTVRFEGTRARNEMLEYTVKYRLAE